MGGANATLVTGRPAIEPSAQFSSLVRSLGDVEIGETDQRAQHEPA
ncbi:MAG: hypothetical protein ACLRSW_15565 [Christensenellaceae bacterium]